MHDIDGIRNISQKLAYPRTGPVGSTSGRSQPDKYGKDKNHAYGVINAVHPRRTASSHMRHGEQKGNNEAAQPESATDMNRPEHTRHQQPHRKCKKQAQHSARQIGSGKRPAHPEMAVTRTVSTAYPARPSAESTTSTASQRTERRRIKSAYKILPTYSKKQRPTRPVQGIHLSVASNLRTRTQQNRQKQTAHHQSHTDPWKRYSRMVPLLASLHTESNSAQHRSHHHHGMKADQTALEKAFQCHLAARPAVIVGIPDNKTGENEKRSQRPDSRD